MRFILFFLFCICLILQNAFSDSAPLAASSVIFSDDGKVVYVNRLKNDYNPIYFEAKNYKLSKDEFSVQNYPDNGLYLIESRKFLWKLDNDLRSDTYLEADLLNDRQFMIIHGPWAGSIKDVAFKIIQNGHMKKIFFIKDFCYSNMDQSFFKHSISHFVWEDDFYLDNNKKEIFLKACGKDFVVDIEKGTIKSKLNRTYFEMHLINLFLGLVFLSPLILFSLFVAKNRMKVRNLGSPIQKRIINFLIILILAIDLLAALRIFHLI